MKCHQVISFWRIKWSLKELNGFKMCVEELLLNSMKCKCNFKYPAKPKKVVAYSKLKESSCSLIFFLLPTNPVLCICSFFKTNHFPQSVNTWFLFIPRSGALPFHRVHSQWTKILNLDWWLIILPHLSVCQDLSPVDSIQFSHRYTVSWPIVFGDQPPPPQKKTKQTRISAYPFTGCTANELRFCISTGDLSSFPICPCLRISVR